MKVPTSSIRPSGATMRDMTQKQFDAACARRGFVREHFGYYRLGTTSVRAYGGNGGPSFRGILAYLIKAHERAMKDFSTNLFDRPAE